MAYVIGVSSGIFGAAPQQEKMQYVTLSQKAQYVLTQGVKFNQIDVESMAEFKEPDIKREMEQVKRLGITFGFHGESGAFGGREIPVKLDSAIEDDYVRSHERVIETFTQAANLGSKYYLLHSSESTPFILLGQHMQPSKLVDFWGRPLRNLLEKDKKMLKWVIDEKREFVWEYTHISPKELWEPRNLKQRVERQLSQDIILAERYKGARLTEEEKKELRAPAEQRVKDDTIEYLKDNIKTFVDRRNMAFGPERMAYFIIAKYMEMTGDKLWKDIVRASMKFNWENLNELEKEVLKNESNWTIDVKEFRERTELWVPAVSAKYLWGHINPDPAQRRYEDPKKILSKSKMYFIVETPMTSPGLENLMRLANPLHFYYLVRHVNFEYFRYAIDFEHVLGNYIDPVKMIEHMPDDGGEYLKVLHLGWPTAIQPAHMPIYVGSEQHQYLYKVLWMLRQKGFTCEDWDSYLIYERGSAPIQQSIIALKLIIKYLEKNTDPKKLPTEFFGVATGELASEERQMRAIDDHARDPLKGLLAIPEEEYTFLSRVATAKPGGAEKWKKEESR